MNGNTDTLLLGAVAYDPKVVTIWDGFKDYFIRHGLPFDYVLYSNYERQVEAHLAGHVHMAWNSPLAWIRAERLGQARGTPVRALVMRDTDCDLASLILVRADSDIDTIEDLRGKTVAVGAADSPQATLIPLEHIAAHGLTPDEDFTVQYHNVLVGKHGDHIGGERNAARALMAGEADAACMIEGNYRLFAQEGLYALEATRVLARTANFDHCNFTVSDAAPAGLVATFRNLLLAMSYDDPEVRPLFEMEGLTAWRDGRVAGYQPLEAAVDRFGYYDKGGAITAVDCP
jgi:phosphonate transport system substrate-binding protein